MALHKCLSAHPFARGFEVSIMNITISIYAAWGCVMRAALAIVAANDDKFRSLITPIVASRRRDIIGADSTDAVPFFFLIINIIN